MKEPVIILGAMDGEIQALKESIDLSQTFQWHGYTIYEGLLNSKKVVIAATGVGKVSSAMMTQKLIDMYSPVAIIFWGIAGTINKNFQRGDIVIAKDSVQHDLNAFPPRLKRGEIPGTKWQFIPCDQSLFNIATSFKDKELTIHTGRILTGDQFIQDCHTESYSYLYKDLEGDCVEMEGSSVAFVSKINEVPHLLMRTISDNASKKEKINLREFLQISSKNALKLISHILKNY